MPAVQAAAEIPTAVLDTNTVLDWLVFQDPGMHALAAAVQAGHVRWAVCERMRDELARTLSYANLAKWSPDSGRVLTVFDHWAVSLPAPAATAPSLACSDADDQVFLDLAVGIGARWLVTHDRALLRLARRAREHGVQIVKPTGWALE